MPESGARSGPWPGPGPRRFRLAAPGLARPLGAAVLVLAVAGAAVAACAAGPGRAAHSGAASSQASPGQASPSQAGTGARSPARAAGRKPDRFWAGTDGFPMPVTGAGPYREPVTGGSYGGYIGMAGNWAHWRGCGGGLVWSAGNARQAAANLATYHQGIGTAEFWFMAGPGVDPNYDGTVAQATRWGRQQAIRALAGIHGAETYPVLWMDVELPGAAPRFTPAPDNGWRAVYTSPCSGRVRSRHIAAQVDRGVVDGFARYLTAHSRYRPGVYSAPRDWVRIFGTGRASKIPGLYEWTYTASTSSLGRLPSAWCLKSTSTCARFFGGQHSSDATALMWQWSGGGGTSNGYGDFDQIDGARTP